MPPRDLLKLPARLVSIAVMDLEMTGLRVESDRVCEIAVVRADGSEVLLEYDTLIKPPVAMSDGAVEVSGITTDMLAEAPPFNEVAAEVLHALQDAVLVCHNVPHDFVFLDRELRQSGVDIGPPVSIDTLEMARRLFAFPRNGLASVCERLGIQLTNQHRALADARATFTAYHEMLDILDPGNKLTVGELIDLLSALAPHSPLRKQQERILREAHRKRHSVWVDYVSTSNPREGMVRREIAIWHFKFPRVQGWCYLREGERVFRIDRMRNVRAGTTKYTIPAFKRRI